MTRTRDGQKAVSTEEFRDYDEHVSSLFEIAARRWREAARHAGAWRATRELAGDMWYFVRDSTPERARARYGDLDYDFESGADTTAANVGWRARLAAALAGAPYQPTVPAEFHEIVRSPALDASAFTFLDVGSGKGRALLLAAEYPFRRIVGVEIVPELHASAKENIRQWKARHGEREIESVRGDARDFPIPEGPLVVYLFNPLPEAALADLVRRVEDSWRAAPRPVFLLYHNAINARVLEEAEVFERIGRTERYALYRARQVSG
ncbi:MAG TPA: class I SAM-dependent methyltransferase [Terriglobales bacterium]|nr:class I SAM-dependent methyltransferase [Terriglobales bacterium]